LETQISILNLVLHLHLHLHLHLPLISHSLSSKTVPSILRPSGLTVLSSSIPRFLRYFSSYSDQTDLQFLVGRNAFFPLLDLTSDFISIKQFSFSFLAIQTEQSSECSARISIPLPFMPWTESIHSFILIKQCTFPFLFIVLTTIAGPHFSAAKGKFDLSFPSSDIGQKASI
jgi:hypothetical protein